MVNVLLVRVAADRTEAGGGWNGPVNGADNTFVCVPIPENLPVHAGFEKAYETLSPCLVRFGVALPDNQCLELWKASRRMLDGRPTSAPQGTSHRGAS